MRFPRFLSVGLWLVLACAPAASREVGSRPPSGGARSAVSSTPATPVDYVEHLVGGARPGDRLPMIVAVHGRGDSPEGFRGLFEGFPLAARVILPRAPEPFGDGFTWFPLRAADGDVEGIARGASAAADRVAATIAIAVRRHPTVGKPVLVGFSQGGMIGYALAVRHPDRIAAAFPIGGFLPEPLVPAGRGALPPIVAFHGEADRVVPLDLDARGAERLRALGHDVTLHVFPGVGHAIPPPIWIPCVDAMGRYLGEGGGPPPP